MSNYSDLDVVSRFNLKNLVLDHAFSVKEKDKPMAQTLYRHNAKITCTTNGSEVNVVGGANSLRCISDCVSSKTIGDKNLNVIIGNNSSGKVYGNSNELVMSGNFNHATLAGKDNSIEMIGDDCTCTIIGEGVKFKLDDGTNYSIIGTKDGTTFKFEGTVGEGEVTGSQWYRVRNCMIVAV